MGREGRGAGVHVDDGGGGSPSSPSASLFLHLLNLSSFDRLSEEASKSGAFCCHRDCERECVCVFVSVLFVCQRNKVSVYLSVHLYASTQARYLHSSQVVSFFFFPLVCS